MLFNSSEYIIFLTIIFLLFHALSKKYKSLFLLIVSYIFYGYLSFFSPFILFVTTLIGYFFAIKISFSPLEKIKVKWLYTGILLNLVILICFREVFKSFIPAIGISFFTFQNISYMIDCYLGTVEPERSILCYALYLSFFPKLLQGPIERASNLIPQFKGEYECKYVTLRAGAQLFIWGMFKKVVLADNLAIVVKGVLNDIHGSTSLALLLLPYIYAIQIYCDFSGYTDMSLGSAKLFGISLTNNFNYPYFASSIQDFWRKWHITLSSWILDYIFKPLQMRWRNYGNYGLIGSLMITFLICGLWHGLTVNYILWGLYHGILISISFLTYRKWQKFCKQYRLNQTLIYIVDVFVTFNLVCISWLIFMTNNLSDTLLILSRNLNTLRDLSSLSIFGVNIGISKYFFMLIFIYLALELLQMNFNIKLIFDKQNKIIRCFFYYVIIGVILFLGCFNRAKFIYFNF